jgi:putative lipoprotein
MALPGRNVVRGLSLLMLSWLLLGCAQGVRTGNGAQISGEVTYRERMALPPDTRIRVWLEDVSLADAPATLLAEQRIESARAVPVPFQLNYDPDQIQPRHRYAVRAEIRSSSDQLLWTTTGHTGILGENQPNNGLTLLLHAVAKAPSTPAPAQHPETTDAPVIVEAARTYVYECDGLEVVVHTAPDALTLYAENTSTDLLRVPSAWGVRYEGAGRLFWSKGDTALLEIEGRRYVDCRSNPRRAPWADAALRGIDFRALGNEPGWSLEVDERNHIRLVTDYGERSLYLPAPAPSFAGGVVRYQVQTKEHDLRLEIEPQACQDSMSGEAFEAGVRVRLNDEQFQGCGRYLPAIR